MQNFTPEELLFLHKIIQLVDDTKTASSSANILAKAGYTRIPPELEEVKTKLNYRVCQDYLHEQEGKKNS